LPSNNEYYKEYRKAAREVESGERGDLTEVVHEIVFGTKTVTLGAFMAMYDGRVATNKQEFILNNCLDLISMINAAKECLEIEGAYVKNVTGSLKVNPAQKELRENLKACNLQLKLWRYF